MKNRALLAVLLVGCIATPALAADVVARAGRWETRGEITYGPNRLRGMPEKELYTNIDCISMAFEVGAKAPLPPPDESCKVDGYRKEAGSLKFTFVCEDATFAFVLTPGGPDAYTGTLVVRAADPAADFTARFTSRRTAARCSAQEIGQHGEK